MKTKIVLTKEITEIKGKSSKYDKTNFKNITIEYGDKDILQKEVINRLVKVLHKIIESKNSEIN